MKRYPLFVNTPLSAECCEKSEHDNSDVPILSGSRIAPRVKELGVSPQMEAQPIDNRRGSIKPKTPTHHAHPGSSWLIHPSRHLICVC